MPPRTRNTRRRTREVQEHHDPIPNQTGSSQLRHDSNPPDEPPNSNIIGSSTQNEQQIGTSSNPIVNESANNKKKRVRGPTLVPATWGVQPENRVSISFNEIGQPNDKKLSCSLASFLGALARNPKYCPLNYNDWRNMPKEYKDDMKAAVKSRFGLSDAHDDFILASINDKWRKWKSRVKKSNFQAGVPIEEQNLNWSDRVDQDQFMDMAGHWSSDKGQRVSEKNKDSRAQLLDVHHMGQRSFAINREIMKEELGRYPNRVEMYERCYSKADGSPASDVVREDIEKMKRLSNHDPQISDKNSILYDENDEFAKVKGPSKGGQVRMYGLGVRATNIHGKRPTRASLLMENLKYKEAIDTLTAEVDKLKSRDQGISRTVVDVDEENNQRPDTRGCSSASQNNKESSTSTSRPMHIKVGSYVVLKSLINSSETVAAGFVREIGGVRVNGMTLGSAFCNILVQSVFKTDEPLAFPYDFIEDMESALGAPVAWPLSSIVVDADRY